MLRRNWDLRISDIIEAIEKILEYVEGMAFKQFADDRKTIDAVVRNFIIIGQAASHLPDDFIEQHPDFLGEKCVICAISWFMSISE
jgi:uncharacterized protein with HEPN domain